MEFWLSWKFLPMNCWFHCNNHEPSPNHRMFFSIFLLRWKFFSFFSALDHSPFSRMILMLQTIPILLYRFPWWKIWEFDTSWELISSGHPDLSRNVSPYLTDCAVPSRRISSWPFSKEFYQVALIDRTSQPTLFTLEKTEHGFDSGLKGLKNDSFCRKIRWRTCLFGCSRSSELILEQWHFAFASQ